ncbi:hypothetical protein KIW84_023833 [Lathyrus oleraceus]|uniref:Aspartic peptidase DDI1-type domain-containing protein n=1 Tax=Pisum sativum TaxID=3888 RepID=A0A9D4YII9_PEA|nr:hypothetical protein KIW84_023833 [Pisum sativum]
MRKTVLSRGTMGLISTSRGRNGRLFAPSTLRVNTEVEAAAKAKGKQVSTEEVTTEEDPPKTAFEKEVDEFMRIIKKSDYKVVDQLNQTPSKISILSLLLCSEAHRAALLKVLNMAYVPPEITVNQLESVVSNVNASRGLGFTDNDLTHEGKNHNKALHITMECKGVVLSHVLVDTGSSLNVLPKKALMKLDCDGIILRPSNLVVRAFDGSKRAVFGEVELPVKIGPQVFKSTFYVMDIQPAYSCLLGRPWIHAVGAVTSTLHQKLKYELEGQIVTGFETTNINEVAPEAVFSPEFEKVGTSISSYKQAVEVVKAGNAQGWGKFVEPVIKEDKFGLGYAPGSQKNETGTLSSGGLVSPHVVNAADEDKADSGCDLDSWIRPCVPGEKLDNWSSEKTVRVKHDPPSCGADHPDLTANDTVMAKYDFDNPIYQAEEGAEEDCELPEGLARLLKQEDRAITPYQEVIETINVGTEDDKKEIKIGARLQAERKDR